MNDDTQSDPLSATGHAEESVKAPTFESSHNKITITVESSEGTFSIEFYAKPDGTEFTTESQPEFPYDEDTFPPPPVITRIPRRRRRHIISLVSHPIAHPETGTVYLKRTAPRAG